MIKSFFGHIRNILVHKYLVIYYGRKLNIGIWQLLMHDISKFSPIEFLESVKYYQGTSSPIPVSKKINGYSCAWQHHKGHNPHHYEYWVDNFDTGLTTIPMPYKYLSELVADWMAAGRTYNGRDFSFNKQCDWWADKRNSICMHPATILALDDFFCKDFDYDYQCKMWRNYSKCFYEVYKIS
jgi:hypothetical protein